MQEKTDPFDNDDPRNQKLIDIYTNRILEIEPFLQDVASLELQISERDREKKPQSDLRKAFNNFYVKHYKHYDFLEKNISALLNAAAIRALSDDDVRAEVSEQFVDEYSKTMIREINRRENMMLGTTQTITNSTAGEGVRLFMIDSNLDLGMMFCDMGVIEFWISEEDLAAKNFDKAYANTAGG